MRTRRSDQPTYITKDGSAIVELSHPATHGHAGGVQSLAVATVQPGASTLAHTHAFTEEIYHVQSGEGRMRLGEAMLTILPGDTVRIPPGTPHHLTNTGHEPLVVLCCCSPAYAHDDTHLID